MTGKEVIIYTKVDEAPGLATYCFLPVVAAFTGAAGVNVETRDISLAGRTISRLPDYLTEEQRQSDDLTELGNLVKQPDANIIKLPCISASLPQLNATIKELQAKGYNLPNYPEDPKTDEEKDIRARYDGIKGSAVNPVLREGNSDRRAPTSVKAYVKANPHPMGKWSPDSKSHVATMSEGDLFSNEIAMTLTAEQAGDAKIEYVGEDGTTQMLLEKLPLIADEIIDATFMSKKALRKFLEEQIEDAKQKDILFSVHLKATMMKVSDPIFFGHVVSVYFKDLFEKHADTFAKLGIHPNNGLGDLYARIATLPDDKKTEIENDIKEIYKKRPALAMVNSDKGITNLHVSSDIIIDASMPAALRASGQMWNPDGKMQDTKYTIPDHSYASTYQAVIDDCKKHGAYDPTKMGTVQNVGLMAKKAEEYGSHNKTFEAPGKGIIRIVAANGETLLERPVEKDDIWRACQVKDLPIQDWVKLAVNRAKASGFPVVFWLDKDRAHDRDLLVKVHKYLQDHDTSGLDIQVMPTKEASVYSIDRMRNGKDTIAATGNVLRDYLTDLYPILEVGTSAKLLSIVPLMNGGGLFETGAGGSAPKHVQQFQSEGHLRWDSLGEYLALAASLEHLSKTFNNEMAMVLSETLDKANARYLIENKSPSRVVNEPDNRNSTFYLTMYWAEEVGKQDKDPALAKRFAKVAQQLKDNEQKINDEMMATQGHPIDYKGYYKPNDEQVRKAMRPSPTLNEIIDNINA